MGIVNKFQVRVVGISILPTSPIWDFNLDLKRRWTQVPVLGYVINACLLSN